MTGTASGADDASAPPRLDLWFVDLEANASDISDCGRRLGLPTEPARSASSNAPAGDPQRIIAYLALRLLLARSLGVDAACQPFARESGGRPFLAGHALQFSLSHSGGHALIALSHSSRIGVDLEFPRSLRMSGPRRTAIEDAGIAIGRGRGLSGATADARTLMAWVRLEAAAKATGEGIGAILARLDARPGRVIPIPDGPSWPVAFDLVLPVPCHGAVAMFSAPTQQELTVAALDANTLALFSV